MKRKERVLKNMDKKIKILINIAYYAAIAGIIFLLLKYLFPVVLPFIVAFIIAAAARKAAKGIHRRVPINMKILSIFFTVIIYVLFLTVIIFVGSKTIPAVGNFIAEFPRIYRTEIIPLIDMMSEKLERILAQADPILVDTVDQGIKQVTQDINQTITSISMNMVMVISELAMNIPSMVVVIVVTVISSFFFVLDYGKMKAFFHKVIPEKKINFFRNVKIYGLNTLKIYIRSYSLLMMLTFTELLIGFLILNIPYPGWIALAIAIFDILPILGTGGILLPWSAILCFLANYSLAAGILILYIVITVIRNILEPKIVGKQMGLHPLATLISLYIGLKLFGLAGLVLFPTTLSVLAGMEREGALHFPWMEKKVQKDV